MVISRPLRRFVAIALPVVVLGSIWNFLAVPLADQIKSDRESIANSRRFLAVFRDLSADIPKMRGLLNQLRTADQSGFFLKQTSPALMSAVMQETVQKLATSQGMDILSSRTLPLADQSGFDRVGVEIECSVSVAVFGAFLQAVATARPAIITEHLVVQVSESGTASTPASGQPLMRTTLRLISYAQRREGGGL